MQGGRDGCRPGPSLAFPGGAYLALQRAHLHAFDCAVLRAQARCCVALQHTSPLILLALHMHSPLSCAPSAAL